MENIKRYSKALCLITCNSKHTYSLFKVDLVLKTGNFSSLL